MKGFLDKYLHFNLLLCSHMDLGEFTFKFEETWKSVKPGQEVKCSSLYMKIQILNHVQILVNGP